jgi:hypothetical protein
MLEPEKIGDNVYYFTLNLQIRFHKWFVHLNC